ncbi:hypothetical protein DPMN_121900 [Dreissena polymorpha]|uniref:Uncharacterized protein n=1 Tax=Dreissena polymorpha TaxID=45954 RepID=A0A9D4GMI6_DREPO|nr:hypothetical protein DPMN_121900 [Dreissena polymorpha]
MHLRTNEASFDSNPPIASMSAAAFFASIIAPSAEAGLARGVDVITGGGIATVTSPFGAGSPLLLEGASESF